jgi:hypothetical protein
MHGNIGKIPQKNGIIRKEEEKYVNIYIFDMIGIYFTADVVISPDRGASFVKLRVLRVI